MEKWFEIFRTGTHTDSAGNERTWTEADLDAIVAKYDPANGHEAPIVIGHPKDNAPAFGWIESLKRVGSTLMAKPKQVIPEFAEMVKKGLFKKRSMSLYKNMTLRHVGFLGAQPPAVKGLADIQFSGSDEGMTIEFDDGWRVNMIGRIFQRLREWAIEKFDTDTADRLVSQWEIDELKKEEPPVEAMSMSEKTTQEKEDEDMDKIGELEAKIKQLETSISNYAEKDKEKEKQLTALRTELDAERKKTRRQDFASFCDGLMVAGKLTPAQKGLALDFMEILSGQEEYEFAEADDKKVKKPPLDAFKAFLSTLPKQVEFSEKAPKDKAARTGSGTGREKAIAEYAEKHPKMAYKDVVLEVSKEHPELFEDRS